jgi:hypothetical protein
MSQSFAAPKLINAGWGDHAFPSYSRISETSQLIYMQLDFMSRKGQGIY